MDDSELRRIAEMAKMRPTASNSTNFFLAATTDVVIKLLDRLETMRTALQEADWVIKKLAPHESLAIQVRGFQPDPEDIIRGRAARKMIDTALSVPEGKLSND